MTTPLRLLFLTKRHPQQRDLIERPFGRFYHLPVVLAALGHDVRVLLFSHRRLQSLEKEYFGVHWSSYDLLTLGLKEMWKLVTAEAMSFCPDWVIGCSDTWFGWLAHRLASDIGAGLAVDAYDNYEAYMTWNLPLHRKWRRAIQAADLVTAAGPQLAALLQRHRHAGHTAQVVPMAADPEFTSMNRQVCRKTLGLPDETPLIGYCGSWSGKRGTQILWDSFERVRDVRPDARLLLTGHPPAKVRSSQGVIALGYLDDTQLPILLNALDIACIITADTSFGRYSYPAKLCEAMACGVPVVATDTEPVRWMLKDDTCFMAKVGNAEDIAARMLTNFSLGRVDYGPLPSWKESGSLLESLLLGCTVR